MGVDEAGGDETTLSVDLFIDRLRICFAHVLNPIPVEYDDAVFDNFVFLAVEADNMAALYESFHRLAFQILNSNRGRTNKTSYSRQAASNSYYVISNGYRCGHTLSRRR